MLGVCVATAVLTGALLIGDSVRGSLQDLALSRLGRIDEILIAPRMFNSQFFTTADGDSADAPANECPWETAVPTILMPGTLETARAQDTARANQISVIGVPPENRFWSLGRQAPPAELRGRSIALTKAVADELGVKPGDEVLLRLARPPDIPGDSPLGEKQDTSISRRLKVADVLAPKGLVRFSLAPTQHQPRNAFVPLTVLQDMLSQPGRVNTVLFARGQPPSGTDAPVDLTAQTGFRPSLEDYGLRVETPAGRPYIQISSVNLVLSEAVVRTTRKLFGDQAIQPIISYLANTTGSGTDQIPYSIITGVDSNRSLGPLRDASGQPLRLADDQIVLNRWAAEDLGVKPGDPITITCYEPQSTHGQLQEQPPVTFRLKAIVDLTDAAGQSTEVADPHFTPELKGVTDQKSINDWDLPFELVEPIRAQDETYWEDHTTTPKAFLSLAAAGRLWKTRWGTISAIRLPVHGGQGAEEVREALEQALDPAELGFQIIDIKKQGLAASAGTTPFDGLFLGFSGFLIGSAMMLIVLLFQLGIENRGPEIGTLAASGVPNRTIGRLLGTEGLIVTIAGATLGSGLAIGYTWLMITGLKTIWLDAITTPFIDLHLTLKSFLVGWLATTVACWMAISWSLRKFVRQSPRQLLAGDPKTTFDAARASRAPRRWTKLLLVTGALAVGLWGQSLHGEAQAATFFAAGAAVLVALLLHTGDLLRRSRPGGRAKRGWSLAGLAVANAARHPSRSTVVIGLVAAACFLIISVGAFRIQPSSEGTGGFALLGSSDQVIHFDLNSRDGRWELGFSDRQSDQLDPWKIEPVRVHAGQDASCLSLYRPQQPRVLGLPAWTADEAAFGWAAVGKGLRDPWSALDEDLGIDQQGKPVIPVVLDMNTAVYSLHLYGGVGSRLEIEDGLGQPVTLEVAGLLKNSMLQGDLLMSEANFLRIFPQTAGYQLFLFRPASAGSLPEGPEGIEEITTLLESTLSDYGLDVVDTRQRLARFLAIQNTYLSTFQMLGALGLLLGTAGLAVVELRSVLERRGEMALMRASGFGVNRLVWLVLLENLLLLATGLAVGSGAALVSLLPHMVPQGAGVPWITLGWLLGLIITVGVAAAWLATRRALAAPLVPALRGE